MKRKKTLEPSSGAVHVQPDPVRGWRVMVLGNKRASCCTITQKTALAYARGLAMRKRAVLFIHGRDSRVREQHSYR